MQIVKALAGVWLCFLILDALWLGVVANDVYQDAMQGLMKQDIPTWPWILFYVMYGVVIVFLTIWPNRMQRWTHTAAAGAMLGVAAYGAYNLTNYAIMQGFPLNIALVDWSWGVCITTLSALCGRALMKR